MTNTAASTVKWHLKRLSLVVLAIVTIIGFSAVLTLVPISAQTTAARTFRELNPKQDGIFFLGHIFAIDIPARSIQVRWVVGACGSLMKDTAIAEKYDLDRSACGQPNVPFEVYINDESQFNYDPDAFNTLSPVTNKSTTVATFQTTHDLDVDTAQLGNNRIFDQLFWYPFDFYHTGAAIYVINTNTNTSLPITRAVFTDPVNNFAPQSIETSSHAVINGTLSVETRTIALGLRRTTNAKLYTLILFIVNWGLTLLVAYITLLVQLGEKLGEGLIVLPLTIILTMPTVRGLFVENPPFGILLDNLGLVLQMIIVSVCSVIILIPTVAKTEKPYQTVSTKEF